MNRPTNDAEREVRHKRVLVLAYFFPPIAVSGSMRPASFCAYLQQFGYEPRVVAAALESVHPPATGDNSLCDLLPEGLAVERLSYVDRRRLLLRVRDSFRRRAASATSTEPRSSTHANGNPRAKQQNWLKSLSSYALDRIFMFPDQQKDWGRAVHRYVNRLPMQERPDLVFATGSPWSALLTGVEVADRLDIPFVADFRDPWAQNMKATLSTALHSKARKLERHILTRATRVTANTNALRDYFVGLDPEFARKTLTLNNGINPKLLDAIKPRRSPESPSAAVELNYFGSISKSRMPKKLLDAIDELHNDGRLSATALRVNFTGPWATIPADLAHTLGRLEALGLVARHAAIPYSECLAEMCQSDNLLILQQGFPMQIPAKIFEYMAMERPIILIGGEGATADLVCERQLGLTCADSVSELKELIMRLVDKDATTPRPSATANGDFMYENLTRRLAGIFDDAIADHAAHRR